jgi:hypothetical protein
LAYLFLPQGGLRAWIQIDVGYLEESLLGEEVEHLQTLVGQGEGVHLVAFGKEGVGHEGGEATSGAGFMREEHGVAVLVGIGNQIEFVLLRGRVGVLDACYVVFLQVGGEVLALGEGDILEGVAEGGRIPGKGAKRGTGGPEMSLLEGGQEAREIRGGRAGLVRDGRRKLKQGGGEGSRGRSKRGEGPQGSRSGVPHKVLSEEGLAQGLREEG